MVGGLNRLYVGVYKQKSLNAVCVCGRCGGATPLSVTAGGSSGISLLSMQMESLLEKPV